MLHRVRHRSPGGFQPTGDPSFLVPISLSCFREAPPSSQSSRVPVGSPEPAAALPTTPVCPARLSQWPLPTSPREGPRKTKVLTADRSHVEATCVLLQGSHKTGANSTGLTPSPLFPVAPESYLGTQGPIVIHYPLMLQCWLRLVGRVNRWMRGPCIQV